MPHFCGCNAAAHAVKLSIEVDCAAVAPHRAIQPPTMQQRPALYGAPNLDPYLQLALPTAPPKQKLAR